MIFINIEINNLFGYFQESINPGCQNRILGNKVKYLINNQMFPTHSPVSDNTNPGGQSLIINLYSVVVVSTVFCIPCWIF